MVKRIIHAVKKMFGHKDECCKPAKKPAVKKKAKRK